MALAIDLPHNSDGEVNWCTFGNILTGELLGQVHCASYLDPLYGPKQQTLMPETSWEYEGIKHNIVILKKRVEGTSLDSFMGRGVINFPVERVAQYMDDVQKMLNWERYLVDIKCIKQLSEDNSDTIVHRHYRTTACLVNVEADFVYYLRSKFYDERFVRTAASVSDTFYPSTSGVYRGKMLPGSGYVLEPYMGDPNRTLVTYMAAISITGVPAIALNKVIKDLSVSIHYLDEYMKRTWVPGPVAVRSSFDDRRDHSSECQPNPASDTSNPDMEAFINQSGSEAEIQAAGTSSSSDIGTIQEDRTFIQEHQGPDYLYKDGEVDWDALGEQITRCILQEVESIAKVDVKYGSGVRVPQHTTNWRFVFEKHDVIVYTKKQENSPIECFLGCGVVDAPMRTVSDFISDIQSAFSWDNTLMDAKYVKVIHKSRTHVDYIACLHYETTKCMVHAKRDNLIFVRCISTNGKFVMSAISVDHPLCPPPPDTTRIKVYSGSGWVMEPYQGSETQTLVTYLAHVDLIGLPAVINNYVLKSHPLAVHYIRLHIPSPPKDVTAGSSCTNTGIGGAHHDEPIALLSDIDQRLEKGWRVSGWNAIQPS